MKSYEILSEILKRTSQHVQPGITTMDLNNVAAMLMKQMGAYSYNRGYHPKWAEKPYEFETCISVNSEIAHGIPSNRILQDGDFVNIDMGIVKDGECADAALTVVAGQIKEEDKRLLKYAKKCLRRAIDIVKDGVTIKEIGEMIEDTAKDGGFVVNRQLTGHAIGKQMHEDPLIYQAKNWMHDDKEGYLMLEKYLDVPLHAGMRICLEPMITSKDRYGQRSEDGWTYRTKDGKKSAMFEHMLEITKTGCNVLTTHIDLYNGMK